MNAEPISCLPASPVSSGVVADVTVVISTFNRGQLLPEAIESMTTQDMRPKRIVVVDDGSTDNTPAVAQQYEGAVEYVRKSNGGKAAALNFVLKSITTKYTWFFDDDDAAYPDALTKLLTVMSDSPTAAFSFGAFDIAKSDTRLLAAQSHAAPYVFGDESVAWQRLRLYRNSTITMSGSLLSTDAVRAVGGLNEDLIRCQDYDLMIRLAARFDFGYCGSSVYVVRDHDGPRGSLDTQHAFADRGKVWSHYNESIGRFLRYELALRAFSVAPLGVIRGQELRIALLNRAWALASKLPLSLSVSDLLEAFAVSCSDPLSRSQIILIEETFHDDSVSHRRTRSVLRLWRLVFNPAGSLALHHVARGLYWQGRKELRLRDRIRLVGIALVLASVSKAGQALWMFNSKAHVCP